jgi:hypothetical protein
VLLRAQLDTRTLVDALCAAENDGDWDTWRTLVAEDLILDHHPLGARVGIDANLAVLQPWRAAIAGYRRELFDMVCEGENAAFRWTVSGSVIDDSSPWGLLHGAAIDVAGATFLSAREGLLVRAVALVTRSGSRRVEA